MNTELKLEIPNDISPNEKAPAIQRHSSVGKSELFGNSEMSDNCFESNSSLSPLSELDVKEVINFPMVPPLSKNNPRSLGCHLKNEPDSPISNTHVNLRRELKSDYGVFPENFEDDVNNWFLYIDNIEKHIGESEDTPEDLEECIDNNKNENENE